MISAFQDAGCRGRPAGFTLAELLVVITLIGILGGYAMLSIGPALVKSPTFSEANRFRGVLRFLPIEAIVLDRSIGIAIDNAGYRVLLSSPAGTWEPIEKRSSFASRKMADTRFVVFDGSGALDQQWTEGSVMEPQIVFLPSGEIEAPGILVLEEAGNAGYLVEYSDQGRWTVSEVTGILQ